jgi:phosphohistidine phosphatase SixA
MKKQRQLSEEGRKVAREMGGAIKALGIKLDKVYTSKLNRAIETGSLLSGTGGRAPRACGLISGPSRFAATMR